MVSRNMIGNMTEHVEWHVLTTHQVLSPCNTNHESNDIVIDVRNQI